MPDITQIIPPRVPLVDARTGMISREWYRFFFNQFEKVGGSSESLEDLQVSPQFDIASVFEIINTLTSPPVVKTTDFAVTYDDIWLINNKPGSTCTVTLPAPASSVGRVLYFQNYQAQLLVSASSNVIPIEGGAASTSILLDVAGETATLVSNGTDWVMTQSVPNNVLLLE